MFNCPVFIIQGRLLIFFVFLVLSFARPKERTKEKDAFSINFSGRHRSEIYDAPKTAVKIWRASPWVSKFCPPILVKKILLFASRILDFFHQYPKGERNINGTRFPRVGPICHSRESGNPGAPVCLPLSFPQCGFRLQYLH